MKLSLITATHQRPNQLQQILLPSILAQTMHDFEWVVINDGGDQETKEIITCINSHIEIKYFETPHIGLCAARNLGLEKATSKLVGFIDDDNCIYPEFVEKMCLFFQLNPTIHMAMPIQNRRRDVYQDGILVKLGKHFISPLPDSKNEDFINNKVLFDSNGFIHKQNDKIRFNEKILIYSDYEYLLRCFSEFGLNSFLVCNEILVEYIQTNTGIIGNSTYKEWLNELEYIWTNRFVYQIFTIVEPTTWLPEKIAKLKIKIRNNEKLPGFLI